MKVFVATYSGKIKVNATIIGPFGIHPDIVGKGFTLTHLVSGRYVKMGLCCKESARLLAETIKEYDWNFTMRPRIAAKIPARKGKALEPAKLIVSGWECPIHWVEGIPTTGEPSQKGPKGIFSDK